LGKDANLMGSLLPGIELTYENVTRSGIKRIWE
jgi:hypothetical protein